MGAAQRPQIVYETFGVALASLAGVLAATLVDWPAPVVVDERHPWFAFAHMALVALVFFVVAALTPPPSPPSTPPPPVFVNGAITIDGNVAIILALVFAGLFLFALVCAAMKPPSNSYAVGRWLCLLFSASATLVLFVLTTWSLPARVFATGAFMLLFNGIALRIDSYEQDNIAQCVHYVRAGVVATLHVLVLVVGALTVGEPLDSVGFRWTAASLAIASALFLLVIIVYRLWPRASARPSTEDKPSSDVETTVYDKIRLAEPAYQPGPVEAKRASIRSRRRMRDAAAETSDEFDVH